MEKIEEITNCDQCFNFCPIEQVKCEKGRALRDSIKKSEEDKNNKIK